MTSDGHDRGRDTNAGGLSPEFNKAGKEIAQPEPLRSVTDTARAELRSENAHEAAIDAHDAKWMRERDKLSNSAVPYPEFDLGSRAHRNLANEYQERRTEWEMQRERIEKRFAKERSDIRNSGPTLSEEFRAQNPPSERERSAEKPSSLADEFKKRSFPAHAHKADKVRGR